MSRGIWVPLDATAGIGGVLLYSRRARAASSVSPTTGPAEPRALPVCSPHSARASPAMSPPCARRSSR